MCCGAADITVYDRKMVRGNIYIYVYIYIKLQLAFSPVAVVQQ
jgi:hypothetical protein